MDYAHGAIEIYDSRGHHQGEFDPESGNQTKPAMTTVTRQIVGYDPNTEQVAFELFIPLDKWKQVSMFVKRNENDPYYIYNYALDIGVTNDIMGIMGQKVAQNLNYFLECEADD